MVKKIGAVFITVLLFCCMSVPAMAVTEDYEGTANLNWVIGFKMQDGTNQYVVPDTDVISLPIYNGVAPNGPAGSLIQIPSYSQPINYLWTELRGFKVTAPSDNLFFGTVVFYLSFYYAFSDITGVTWENVFEDNNGIFYFTAVDSRGAELVSSVSPTYFEPTTSPYSSYSQGYTLRIEVDVPQESPYISLDFSRPYSTLTRASGFSSGDRFVMFIPSATVLIERTSEETQAIEEVANIIIEQNNISNEFYSNVINKVDQIYSEVNNIQTLQQEVINRMDEFNDVTSIPGSVTTKTEQAAQLITGLEGLEKPDPEQIVPDLTVDTTEISQVLGAFFQNALIMQVLLMSLGFCLVSYVLYGKK